MKHLINIVVFILLWGIGYAIGDGYNSDYKDYLATGFYLAGLGWLFYKYG